MTIKTGSLAGWVSVPMAHNISTTGGAWDEVLSFGLMMLLLLALALYGYLTSRRSKK